MTIGIEQLKSEAQGLQVDFDKLAKNIKQVIPMLHLQKKAQK